MSETTAPTLFDSDDDEGPTAPTPAPVVAAPTATPPLPPGTPPDPSDPPLPELDPQFPGMEATITEGRAWLRDRLLEGATCAMCDRHAQMYKRTINSGMARALIAMFRAAPIGTWVHGGTVVGRSSRDESLLRYWGLTEEELTARPDGGRSGWWRVTERGAAFVERRLRVPRYALVYNKRFLGYDDETVTIGIEDALGERFDYNELMGRT